MRGAFSVLAAVILASSLPAIAEEHGSPAEATAESSGSGGSHGESHWSLAAELIPVALRDDATSALGDSFVGHTPVATIDHVIFAVVVVVMILVLLVFARRRMKAEEASLLPAKRFSALAVFQFLADALLGLMEPLLGRERALKFLPLVGSLGLFILFSNLLGLVPGFLPPTSNLNTTFALGSVVFVATHYYGVRAHGPAYVKHFFGPIIKWYALPLMILMFAIEMVSHIARPVSLAIRLFGNMTGDHAAIAAFLAIAWWFVPVLPLPLGLFVCLVQTLVFCILSTVYIHMATEEAEEGHSH